jgi:hypothetical protein
MSATVSKMLPVLVVGDWVVNSSAILLCQLPCADWEPPFLESWTRPVPSELQELEA